MISRIRIFLLSTKTFFLSRSLREKVLALLLLGVVCFLWLFHFHGRASDQFSQFYVVRQQMRQQTSWLEGSPRIERDLRETLARLSEAELPDRNVVTGQIDTLVREFGFQFRIDPPQSQRQGPLTFNTINLAIERADLSAIISFTSAVKEQLPYVNLEQMTLVADRRNPTQLDARLRLIAIELNP